MWELNNTYPAVNSCNISNKGGGGGGGGGGAAINKVMEEQQRTNLATRKENSCRHF